ncbi:ankyrin repeat domain-containing protein [Muriicola sp. Z0-33]|uniref:ankyrin repeat domain-containing protein n=1 Tax=Muriicola sp. Z0-33 TaxID=2816957 RepID=UPI002238C1BD|nr:ankyrin repeat domain-containing protein [Muriicola sp. Z0-33]MCW5515027.1 ankyrin repeat domain-containing protein [Muriicola sp. Z0-33]
MKVYKPKTVNELELFYGDLLFKIEDYKSISDHLGELSTKMWEGVQAKNEAVLKEISNYHWKHLGKPATLLLAANLTEEDCRQSIANEYGFRRWTEVAHIASPYNSVFEALVNAMLEGNFDTVKRLISENGNIVNCKSPYGHKATLLHYAVSNGVELWRQKVPLNLPEIVAYLIEQGANRKAKMKVYGGEYMAAELLPSSAHPVDAGISKELRKQFES